MAWHDVCGSPCLPSPNASSFLSFTLDHVHARYDDVCCRDPHHAVSFWLFSTTSPLMLALCAWGPRGVHFPQTPLQHDMHCDSITPHDIAYIPHVRMSACRVCSGAVHGWPSPSVTCPAARRAAVRAPAWLRHDHNDANIDLLSIFMLLFHVLHAAASYTCDYPSWHAAFCPCMLHHVHAPGAAAGVTM